MHVEPTYFENFLLPFISLLYVEYSQPGTFAGIRPFCAVSPSRVEHRLRHDTEWHVLWSNRSFLYNSFYVYSIYCTYIKPICFAFVSESCIQSQETPVTMSEQCFHLHERPWLYVCGEHDTSVGFPHELYETTITQVVSLLWFIIPSPP